MVAGWLGAIASDVRPMPGCVSTWVQEAAGALVF
jgi:hypothetical protein